MLVIMALVTTFMTSPHWSGLRKADQAGYGEPEAEEETGLDTAATYRIGAGGKSEYQKDCCNWR